MQITRYIVFFPFVPFLLQLPFITKEIEASRDSDSPRCVIEVVPNFSPAALRPTFSSVVRGLYFPTEDTYSTGCVCICQNLYEITR